MAKPFAADASACALKQWAQGLARTVGVSIGARHVAALLLLMVVMLLTTKGCVKPGTVLCAFAARFEWSGLCADEIFGCVRVDGVHQLRWSADKFRA